jgi:hypothetical protein
MPGQFPHLPETSGVNPNPFLIGIVQEKETHATSKKHEYESHTITRALELAKPLLITGCIK